MATIYGTREFGTADLEGLAQYLRQRARGLKPHKRDALLVYASIAENAADRIVNLEHFKQTALKLEKDPLVTIAAKRKSEGCGNGGN